MTSILKVKINGEWIDIPAIRGIDGKDGTSVTITSIVQSDEDDGVSIVTFSDGTTLNIKNGSKGIQGVAGQNYVLTEADKEEIAQMAVDLIPIYNGEVEEV